MTMFIEETSIDKIAKALIINHEKLWILVCDKLKESIRHNILEKIRALGIEPGSRLYQQIDYSICTKESIKDRQVHWSHDIIICNINDLISEILNITCVMTYVNETRF